MDKSTVDKKVENYITVIDELKQNKIISHSHYFQIKTNIKAWAYDTQKGKSP